jgi:hypothetical protein
MNAGAEHVDWVANGEMSVVSDMLIIGDSDSDRRPSGPPIAGACSNCDTDWKNPAKASLDRLRD